MSNRKVIEVDIKDDSMTDEAIQKAEEDLKVTKSPAKVVQSPVKAAKATREPDVKEAAPDKENSGDTTNTTPIKVVSKATVEEVAAKIKARAERFGGYQSDEAKKLVRAAKFGRWL